MNLIILDLKKFTLLRTELQFGRSELKNKIFLKSTNKVVFYNRKAIFDTYDVEFL